MYKFSRILALIFAALFVWAAVLQHNDPDFLLWYAIYGVAALACILYYFNRFHPILGLILSLIYFAEAVMVWPEKFEGFTIGEGAIENIERGREAFGLLITGLFMVFLTLCSYRKKRS